MDVIEGPEKKRLCWINQAILHTITNSLIRGKAKGESTHRRWWSEDGGSDWSPALSSPHQQLKEAGNRRVLRVLEGDVALWGFRLKASRIVRNTFLVFSGTKFVVFCYCNPLKLTQCLLASWDCCEAQRGKKSNSALEMIKCKLGFNVGKQLVSYVEISGLPWWLRQ